MRIIELLQHAKIDRTKAIEEVLGKAARDLYPLFQSTEWSAQEVFDFVLYVDFKQEDLNKILNRAVKYGNIWAFS